MADAKHTPGPWVLDPPRMAGLNDHEYHTIEAGDGVSVEGRFKGFTTSSFMSIEDARLIAAAPELLKAPIELRKQINDFCIQYGEADFYTGDATAAITQATGSPMADRILALCTGTGCHKGRTPQTCNCRPRLVVHPDLHRITLTELDLEIPPSDTRVIAPPPRRAALPDPMRGRRLTRAAATAAATAAAALIAFGVLLLCAAHQAHAATATVWVGSR